MAVVHPAHSTAHEKTRHEVRELVDEVAEFSSLPQRESLCLSRRNPLLRHQQLPPHRAPRTYRMLRRASHRDPEFRAL